ncbi:methylase [Vagococcus lutrae]|uniref:methylase n=1 Tax=Vagococcus lutrae TaxID=81947 RepID=UPI00288C6D07|nr:methylase [Vagococcus lutrae]MDT2817541.1 methylase [Vagococcus lutrae]
MSGKLIKSKYRVQKHGEVFTPNWMVEQILDSPGVKEACEDLKSTFLEPSAGEGNFLSAILNRKLHMVEEKYSENLVRYENYSLYALSTIYGIELLEDNAQMCVMNLYEVYKEQYFKVAQKFGGFCKKEVNSSAKVIISANIAQGNFLTKLKSDGKQIVFSEWKLMNELRKDINTIKVQRTEYSLDDIISGKKNELGSLYKVPEPLGQIDLFELFEEENKIEKDSVHYVISKITDVYKEETEHDE